MEKKPLTYFFEFTQCGDFGQESLPMFFTYMLKSLSCHGVRHIVLTNTMFQLMMRYKGLSYKVKDAVEGAGLDFVDAHSICSTWWDLNEPDESRRAEMIATHMHTMALAASMGVKTITIHVGGSQTPVRNTPPDPWLDAISQLSLEQMIDNAINALKVLVPYAESLGITICIENIYYVCTTPEVLLEIKRHFPSEALGLCCDVGHANVSRPLYEASDNPVHRAMAADASTPLSLLIVKQMLPHIVTCHLHDNNGLEDRHLLPGMGTLDWDSVSALLRQAPRLQCLQSEVMPVQKGITLPTLVGAFNRIFGEWAE